MDSLRRHNELAWERATLRDAKAHAMSAGALFLVGLVIGMAVDIRFSIDDGVAFVTELLAAYINPHATSLLLFMVVCAALAPFYRLRHVASALKNLVAGTMMIAVALATGSLGGMLAVEFVGAAAGPLIPVHDFLRPSLLIVEAWFYAGLVVTMVLGIGNAGILFDKRGAARR